MILAIYETVRGRSERGKTGNVLVRIIDVARHGGESEERSCRERNLFFVETVGPVIPYHENASGCR
jgi:hypothetical protein